MKRVEPNLPDVALDAGRAASLSPSTAPLIRIVIAGGHQISRSGLRKLLEDEQDFVVTGEAESAADTLSMTQQTLPDVVLIEPPMPGMSTSEVTEQLCALPGVKVLLLAAAIENPQLVQALRSGLRGVLLKDTTADLLFKGIRRVSAGQYWVRRETLVELLTLGPEERAGQANGRPAANAFGLTRRERDIVSAVLGGYSNREIAGKLRLSEDTVKHHLTNVFDKTGASTRLELALFAIHHRLVDH